MIVKICEIAQFTRATPGSSLVILSFKSKVYEFARDHTCWRQSRLSILFRRGLSSVPSASNMVDTFRNFTLHGSLPSRWLMNNNLVILQSNWAVCTPPLFSTKIMFPVIVTHTNPQEIFASSFSAHIICVTNERNCPMPIPSLLFCLIHHELVIMDLTSHWPMGLLAHFQAALKSVCNEKDTFLWNQQNLGVTIFWRNMWTKRKEE